MDSGAEWVRLTTRGAVSESAPETVQQIEHAGGGSSHTVLAPLFKGWDGYALELLGRAADRFPSADDLWPRWQFGNFVLETWLQLAYIPDAPLCARILWTPATEVVKSIEVLRDDWTDNDLRAAGKALRLLENSLKRGGKQRGDGRIWSDDQAFITDLESVCDALWSNNGHRTPAARSVKRKLSIGQSTLYAKVKDATGKRWPEWARDYAAARYVEFNRNRAPHNE